MTKKKPKVDWKVLCTALLCITGLEVYALSQEINGTLFSIVLVIIAGIAGITIPNPLVKR